MAVQVADPFTGRMNRADTHEFTAKPLLFALKYH